MKNNGVLSRAFKAMKKFFDPKPEKAHIEKAKPEVVIPKHETKLYHNPPCFGIAKDYEKKRRAKRRQQKLSRRINRVA